jgi:hypothetical protein
MCHPLEADRSPYTYWTIEKIEEKNEKTVCVEIHTWLAVLRIFVISQETTKTHTLFSYCPHYLANLVEEREGAERVSQEMANTKIS